MGPWISTDPDILGGKPYIRGTRISVQHILDLLASGATQDDILRAHPQITPEGLAAALEMLDAIESLPITVSSPFIVTAERKEGTVRVRVRPGNVSK